MRLPKELHCLAKVLLNLILNDDITLLPTPEMLSPLVCLGRPRCKQRLAVFELYKPCKLNKT